MTNLEKLIETLQNAPIEKTACFISKKVKFPCNYCINGAHNNELFFCVRIDGKFEMVCEDGIRQWLESEVE